MIHLNILPVWQNLFNFLKKNSNPKLALLWNLGLC